ncbi:MAG: ABC transporter ATP-binding protein [Chloroflexi bacterium]|nr:ABC transporter ATP-binding protein [Chloroflexota bacterium]
MIEVRDLTFAYGRGKPVFQRFNWTVAQGESWSVIGPSGCGKTTLLYLLAGLRVPHSGSVTVGGRPLVGPRLSTGLILQHYGLLPWATAFDNVVLGMKVRGVGAGARRRTTEGWMTRLGIEHVRHHYPSQLSGGQRQRVAIARTLALEPDLLLMDEPFSSLDALTREEMQDMVLALRLEGRVTTVLVTHSVEEALLLGRNILVLGQPPIATARVIANPGGGQEGYRTAPAFHEFGQEVRKCVQEARAGVV